MAKSFRRPKDKTELDDFEVRGLWKAIALAKRSGDSNERITLATIQRLHKTMFEEAIPEIAGRFRRDGEDVKKLMCIEPPPGRLVDQKIYEAWGLLDKKMATVPRHPMKSTTTYLKSWRAEVFMLAAWTQHQIAAIHPFCDGNGRMARLLTNLILSRYGLPPSQVKYEGEDKAHYLQALCQIDLHGNYEPLKQLIVHSVREAYAKERKLRMLARSA